ncbi:tudor domain-containing protein 7-like isoform X3 [Dreissena polymorpha]|uniref:tudor domain-containing protein 7-like isoform X3 n=1 Tax=Dreissena polymorpha TaxID=45954 RepID=UPI002264D06C|nr:tudor domain-containing protein 7-like isoform X3 [Dreissena polymorpha]
MEEDKELKNVKSMLRSVLMSSKDGVPAYQVQRDYKEIVGEFIPFKKFGHSSFENFIVSIPDVVIIDRRGGEVILKARADEATSHVQKLISKQRGKKLKKPARRPRGGGAGQYLSRGGGRAPPRGRPYVYPTTPIHRHGMPSFLPQTPSPQKFFRMPILHTDLRIHVGNSSVGTRTVAVNRLLNTAMTQAARDTASFSRPGVGGGRSNLPPRFRKQLDLAGQGQGHSQTTPFRRSPPRGPEFAKLDNAQGYVDALKKYLEDTCQTMKHTTLKSGNGYVCSLEINRRTFGSEDIFQTALEAEGAAAKRALIVLEVKSPTDWKGEIDWNAPSIRGGNKHIGSWAQEVSKEDSLTVLPPEQIQMIKLRVKEILKNKKNGLWATVIPHFYMETYKEEAPKDLGTLLKSWTDIAYVEMLQNTDREIVYPILVDENMDPYKSEEKSKMKSVVIKIEKSLTIPRVLLIDADTTQVTLYTTFVDHPGCFYCQREDSIIDTISQALQAHCKVAGAVDAKSLKKGQFCAGLFSGDGMWTRAEILEVKDNGMLELLFVDYGNTDDVKVEDIRWLSPETAQFPPQAINCCLYGIEPLQGETAWSSKATELFEELVGEEALVGFTKTIYEEDLLVEFELFLKSDMSQSINNKLVQAEVAYMCCPDLQTVANEDDFHPDDITLPDENEWDVHVTFLSSSTDSVMLRLVGDNYSDKLVAFQSVLQEAFKDSCEETPLQENVTYVALDDDLYHRVRVISKGEQKVSCYFLDNGDTDDFLPEQLHVLDPKINKMLPYQAVEVRLYGLDDVCTNITTLDSLVELAIGKTLVAEVIERDEIPSVVLYDTSGDVDININETILRTIESEGGGIDTPRTVSPSPKNSATATPTSVLSPVPNIDTKIDESKNRNPAINDVASAKSVQKLTVNAQDIKSLDSDIKSLRLANGSMDQENNNLQQPSENLKRAITKNPAKMDQSELKQFKMPDVGEYFDVHINFVNDPHNFVCIPYNEMGRLNKLLVDMLKFYPEYNAAQLSRDEIQVGKVYAGVIDKIWYRVRAARILGEDLVSVYKVDIGEHAAISVSSLKPLLPQYTALPMMALNARLGSIQSSTHNWLEAAKYKFIELAQGHDLVALVRGLDSASGIADLRLIDTSSEKFDICIDEVLVRFGYATLV